MPNLLRKRRVSIFLGLTVVLSSQVALVRAQNVFNSQGAEYAPVGSQPGDQVYPQVALNMAGGYVVWQDNATDGDGLGISARRLNRGLSGEFGVFRVNQEGTGDQRNPQVAILKNGGAVFVWQGGVNGFEKIRARFLKADGTFATGDVPVSSYPGLQSTPVVASLADGIVAIVWTAFGEDGDMEGVFMRRFSQDGQALGLEMQVNQSTRYNQRNPAMALLPGGGLAIVWVSESLRGIANNVDESRRNSDGGGGADVFDVDVVGRIFNIDGTPATDELKLNSKGLFCANPAVAATASGFTVVWSGKANGRTESANLDESWDIYARVFNAAGGPNAVETKANSHTFGDQFLPKVASLKNVQLILWTSFNQDGSREGIVGRLAAQDGQLLTPEFRVNTTVAGAQIHPAIASTGEQDFLAVWTSFVGGEASFDLKAQRYVVTPSPLVPPTPFVMALSQTRLSVTWPEVQGYNGVRYEVYIDGAAQPNVVDSNGWTATGLAPATAHSFRLAYRLPDGTSSSLSDAISGRTWGEDENFDGLPDDWQAQYFGNDRSKWPAATADTDNDGANNLQEFLAGTNPIDSQSVLKTHIETTTQGARLFWNTEPGAIYQVQSSEDLAGWASFGSARFAAGKADSVPVPSSTEVAIYRIIRIR